MARDQDSSQARLEIKFEVCEGPVDPGQLAAWRWLWRRLLGGFDPEKSDAPEASTSEASKLESPRPRGEPGEATSQYTTRHRPPPQAFLTT